MNIELDKLEQLARAAMPGQGVVPDGETNEWWLEGEDVVEGFEGEVATCRRYDVADFIAAANPAAVLALIERLRSMEDTRTPKDRTLSERDELYRRLDDAKDRLRVAEAIVRDLADSPDYVGGSIPDAASRLAQLKRRAVETTKP